MSGLLYRHSASLTEMAWMSQKINEIKRHPAWQETLDDAGSEQLLMNESMYTYLLRPGKDMRHYFLSFVEGDGSIQHRLVKIELSARGWYYANGGNCIRESINDLIPVAMHVAPEICRPYRAARVSLFSLS